MKRMIKKHRKSVTKKHGGSRIVPGVGTRQNYSELFNQYCKLAERGDAGGQFELGMMFFYGQGVPQSAQEAAVWFRKAAEQGHAEAQAALVICPSPTTVDTTPPNRCERSSGSMGSKGRGSSLGREMSLS